MNSILRNLQLNIQGAKTDIYPKEDFARFISDEEFNDLNDLVNDILNTEATNPRLFSRRRAYYLKKLKLFAGKLGRGEIPKDKVRFFKRLLTGFTHIGAADLTSRCFVALQDNPVVTDKIVTYFKTFLGGSKIPRVILSLIKSNELFDYQVARLLEIYLHKREKPESLEDLLFSYAVNRRLNWAVRMNALVVLSFFQLATEKRKEIVNLFGGETNFKIKKAILLCVLQAPRDVKNKFINECLSDIDYRVGLFAKFLKDIIDDKTTQGYELVNLERLNSRLFIEESYKLHLLKESDDLAILDKLKHIIRIKNKKKGLLPRHTRTRLSGVYKYIKKRIREIKTSAT